MQRAMWIPVLLCACASCGGRPESAAERARQLMEVWETGDVELLAEIAAPGIVYDDVPNGERFEGLEEASGYVRHVHAWAGQVDIEVTAVHGNGDAAYAEWVMTGVQDRPIPGRIPVATDRKFEIRGLTLVETRDGRIARAADYMDVLRFVVQLGGRVELPGGVVVPGGGESGPEAEVLAVVDAALERISAEDFVGLTDLMLEGAVTAAAGTSTRTGESFADIRTRDEDRAGSASGDLLERGFDPDVRISGPVAMVWLPYDFYRDGAWSHCGVDVFTLLRVAEEWRIATITYSVEQPPDCRAHPDGPPGS
ncbi:MAG: nuclear transport factor 2 family protein [Gemmatimonadota bacterium]|nr:nuclear transport factor 2 family protein [Gemmatimonadota bacterium]